MTTVGGIAALAGCLNSGEQADWQGGDIRIDNNSETPHTVTLQYSDVTSRGPEVKGFTPTPPDTLEFTEPVEYDAPPEAVTPAGMIAYKDSEGFVKARATVDEMEPIELWIELPVRDIYEINIAADGTVTWAYFGTE